MIIQLFYWVKKGAKCFSALDACPGVSEIAAYSAKLGDNLTKCRADSTLSFGEGESMGSPLPYIPSSLRQAMRIRV